MKPELVDKMLKTCTDSRSCNKFLRENGLSQFRIRSVPRTRDEPRRTYELMVVGADYYYHRIQQSSNINDCISAIKFY